MEYKYKVHQHRWQKINGEKIENISKYVLDYLSKNPNAELHIGTDSQYIGKHRKIKYVSVIAFRDGNKGVHFVMNTMKVKVFHIGSKEKLWNEVFRTMDILDHLHKHSLPYSKAIIEFDLNPNKEHQTSNSLLNEAAGRASGLGCKVICKYSGLVAVKAANQYCQRGKR